MAISQLPGVPIRQAAMSPTHAAEQHAGSRAGVVDQAMTTAWSGTVRVRFDCFPTRLSGSILAGFDSPATAPRNRGAGNQESCGLHDLTPSPSKLLHIWFFLGLKFQR